MGNQIWAKIRRLPAPWLVVATLVGASAGQSQAAPGAPSAAAPAAAAAETLNPSPIPLPEIATEAEAALARIRDRTAELPDNQTVSAVIQQSPLLTREIDARLRQTRRILAQRPSIQMLSDLETEWRPLRRNLPHGIGN